MALYKHYTNVTFTYLYFSTYEEYTFFFMHLNSSTIDYYTFIERLILDSTKTPTHCCASITALLIMVQIHHNAYTIWRVFIEARNHLGA